VAARLVELLKTPLPTRCVGPLSDAIRLLKGQSLAWVRLPDAQSLKACPVCGDTALEGETTCTQCGTEPQDDETWRSQPAAGSAAMREAIATEVGRAIAAGSSMGDTKYRYADRILAALSAQTPDTRRAE
jgi:hypothetical protein